VVIAAPRVTSALPVFARIYGKPCGACHTTFPQLNPEGEDFRVHAFHSLKPEVEPIRVGKGVDVPGTLPLALYFGFGEDVESKDLAGPHSTTQSLFNLEFLKILGGGEIGRHVAFMLDYELVETEFDEKKLVRDPPPYLAYLSAYGERWGWLGTLKAGWFELPLTVSPDIHRLSVRPYLIYGLNGCGLLGVAPRGRACEDLPVLGQEQIGADLSAVHPESGFAVSIGFTNGSNREPEEPASRDLYLHLTQSLGFARTGFLLFYSPDLIGHGVSDHALRVGPDLDVYSRRFRLLGQFLAGYESNPTGRGEALWYYGGFLEVDHRLTTTLSALARIDVAWTPRFDDRDRGGSTSVRRELWGLTGGMQWLIEDNLKLVAEVTYAEDHGLGPAQPENTWVATLRVVTAFWPLTPPLLSRLTAARGQTP